MDNNKGQTIFLSVIGIATLLVAIIGATFAYFSLTVSGNDKASSIYVTTTVLGQIEFVDGAEINVTNFNLPEGSSSNYLQVAQKTFHVKNTADQGVLTNAVKYQIDLNVTSNTINDSAFTYTLTAAMDDTNKTSDSIDKKVDTKTQVPATTTTNVAGGTFAAGTQGNDHTWTLTLWFYDSDASQNSLQGKNFNGKIQVNLYQAS